MPTSPSTSEKKARSVASRNRSAVSSRRASVNGSEQLRPSAQGFVLPLVHVAIPDAAVSLAFWGALAGSAVVGAVDPPLAVLIGASVIVARRGRRN